MFKLLKFGVKTIILGVILAGFLVYAYNNGYINSESLNNAISEITNFISSF